MAKIRKTAKKKAKPTPERIEQTKQRTEVRGIFRNAGFTVVDGVHDKKFSFNERDGDFDDVFVFENILVFVEYTISKHAWDHLKNKKLLFDHVCTNPAEFIESFEKDFPTFKQSREQFYSPSQCRVIILYCSKHAIDSSDKKQIPKITYFDYPILRYFHSLTNSVKSSARFELFAFLGLDSHDVGKDSITTSDSPPKYQGTILPEDYSNFSKGYKVVSFYVDPSSLLEKSYVLRKDGWKDETDLYQRMISNKKIRAIRRYLNTKERVFVNNIIVTLPTDTKILDSKLNTIDFNDSSLQKPSRVWVQVPSGFNRIGLVDGQHRVFAYHEGGEYENKIKILREKQNLLATGIIYPENISEHEKFRFESELFLEINSTQTGAGAVLKQAIGLSLKPFLAESIAKAVLNRLNAISPFENQFETRFYETDKIKTASIVSYALRPIVKLSGDDSFYTLWDESSKSDLEDEKDRALLDRYVNFCANEIRTFFKAVKTKVDENRWTPDKKVRNKVLSPTIINGFIICLRKLIRDNKTGDLSYYQRKLDGLNDFNFSTFKSSQYGRMAEHLYNKYFKSGS